MSKSNFSEEFKRDAVRQIMERGVGCRVNLADADPVFTTRWKTSIGTFEEVGAATIIAISDAILAHVDHYFALEASVLADIDNRVITTTTEVDNRFASM